MDDPKTYAAPFTISLPLTSPPGYELLPYECHEGNYGLPSALSAERQEDAATSMRLRLARAVSFGPAFGGAEKLDSVAWHSSGQVF